MFLALKSKCLFNVFLLWNLTYKFLDSFKLYLFIKYTFVCTCVYLCTCVYTHVHTWSSTCVRVCIHEWTHVYEWTHVWMCMCMWTCTCVHAHMYVHAMVPCINQRTAIGCWFSLFTMWVPGIESFYASTFYALNHLVSPFIHFLTPGFLFNDRKDTSCNCLDIPSAIASC